MSHKTIKQNEGEKNESVIFNFIKAGNIRVMTDTCIDNCSCFVIHNFMEYD